MDMQQALNGLQERYATYDATLAAYTAAGGMVLSKTHPARAAFRQADVDLNNYLSDNAVRPLLKQAMAAGIKLR